MVLGVALTLLSFGSPICKTGIGETYRVVVGIDKIPYNISGINMYFYFIIMTLFKIVSRKLRVLLVVMVAVGLVMVTINETSSMPVTILDTSHAFSLIL